MDDEVFRANTKERCYVCKKQLFSDIIRVSLAAGITHVAHGANVDDLNDYRPGMRACKELGVVAPLVDAGLNKEEIRQLSRKKNLDTSDKPAMACLATRIPYGTHITVEILGKVERAEAVMHGMGFPACRVRYHGHVARIELPPGEIAALMDDRLRGTVVEKVKAAGFLHVSLDLEGYSQGSMNRVLVDEANAL